MRAFTLDGGEKIRPVLGFSDGARQGGIVGRWHPAGFGTDEPEAEPATGALGRERSPVDGRVLGQFWGNPGSGETARDKPPGPKALQFGDLRHSECWARLWAGGLV